MTPSPETPKSPREQRLEKALLYIATRNWLKSSEGRSDAWKWLNEFIEVAQEALK